MTIIDRLSSSLKRRDEIPNQELAKEIVENNDHEAIKELIKNLNNKREVQNDCIKVLYEIGYQKPHLITSYYKNFVLLLKSKNNRLQWGAMTALGTITRECPEQIYSELNEILQTADNGSVITKDHAINILIHLCTINKYREQTFALLLDQLEKSPVNQLPMYAERALTIIDKKNRFSFISVLTDRLDDIEKETKRKRVEKVISILNK
jgi:hypothetical protein